MILQTQHFIEFRLEMKFHFIQLHWIAKIISYDLLKTEKHPCIATYLQQFIYKRWMNRFSSVCFCWARYHWNGVYKWFYAENKLRFHEIPSANVFALWTIRPSIVSHLLYANPTGNKDVSNKNDSLKYSFYIFRYIFLKCFYFYSLGNWSRTTGNEMVHFDARNGKNENKMAENKNTWWL